MYGGAALAIVVFLNGVRLLKGERMGSLYATVSLKDASHGIARESSRCARSGAAMSETQDTRKKKRVKR